MPGFVSIWIVEGPGGNVKNVESSDFCAMIASSPSSVIADR